MAPRQEPDPIKQAFLDAFPNPYRIRCPGESVLRALVHNQLPVTHAASKHLTECSPCFREFLQYQAEWKQKQRRTWALLASAALIAVAVLLNWLWREQTPRFYRAVASNRVTTQTVMSPVFLNFSATENRGEPTHGSERQVFAKSNHELSVFVPLGTPVGRYIVELRSLDERVVMSFPGLVSNNSEGATILRARVDFERVSPGEYELRWQGPGPASLGHGTFRILQEPSH